MGATHAIKLLITETQRYLTRFSSPEVIVIARDLAKWGKAPVNPVTSRQVPACAWLRSALTSLSDADELRQAIDLASPYLLWVTYDYADDGIGPYFPRAHAFTTIIGADGPVHAGDWQFGLFVMAPRLLYRDHRHLASELYLPLTGPHRWRFGIDQPWHEIPAHRPVWNEPWTVHATLTGDVPFLGFYIWTRDIDAPAKVVHASDWDKYETSEIESGSL